MFPLRISLRSLVLLVTALSVGLGMLVYPARQRQHTIDILGAMGAELTYDYQWGEGHAWKPNAAAPGSRWLKVILGDKYQANVVEVQLFSGPGMSPEQFTDSHAQRLAGFSEVRWLVLMDTTMTDSGLAYLCDLKKLERLDIEGSPVTVQGVEALRRQSPHVVVYCDEALP